MVIGLEGGGQSQGSVRIAARVSSSSAMQKGMLDGYYVTTQ